MGLFDEIRCDMALPKGDYPDPTSGRIFQTKDIEKPYLHSFLLTKDGILIKYGNVRLGRKAFLPENQREIPFEGSFHFHDFEDGRWWRYKASFEKFRCAEISLVEYKESIVKLKPRR